MNELLDSDSARYDPEAFASLGDDARKAARENAVTPAYEGEVGQDDGTNDDYFDRLERDCCSVMGCIAGECILDNERG